jgi:hypothetical protein
MALASAGESPLCSWHVMRSKFSSLPGKVSLLLQRGYRNHSCSLCHPRKANHLFRWFSSVYHIATKRKSSVVGIGINHASASQVNSDIPTTKKTREKLQYLDTHASWIVNSVNHLEDQIRGLSLVDLGILRCL